MTEKQVDAAINVPVNYCDILGLVVPYKSLTMIVTSFPCLKCNRSPGEGGGGDTLHKFGQGFSVEDIFHLSQKITGFRFQPPKNNSIFGSKT